MKISKKWTSSTWSWRKFALTFCAEIIILLLIILGLFWWAGKFNTCDGYKIIPGSMVVFFKPTATSQQASFAVEQAGLKSPTENINNFDSFHAVTIEVPKGKEEYYSKLISQNALVDNARPNRYGCLF